MTHKQSQGSSSTMIRSAQRRHSKWFLGLVLWGSAGLLLPAGGGPEAASLLPAIATAAAAPPGSARLAVARKKPAKPVTDDDIMQEAQAAYVRGERQRAIDLAMQVAQKNGAGASAAWRFIGLAACSVRSSRLATKAYSQMTSAEDRKFVVDACQRNGLKFDNDEFNAD